MNWKEERKERLARQAAAAAQRALDVLGLEVGQRVWYWNKHQDIESQWITGHVFGGGSKDGYATVDVAIEDAEGVLPENYRGFVKWGYGWQVKPYTEQKPPDPDLSEVWP